MFYFLVTLIDGAKFAANYKSLSDALAAVPADQKKAKETFQHYIYETDIFFYTKDDKIVSQCPLLYKKTVKGKKLWCYIIKGDAMQVLYRPYGNEFNSWVRCEAYNCRVKYIYDPQNGIK